MRPKVSIIIPAYNQREYLAEAIQSVCDQTYRNWELVVVDDGSTDATAEVVANFSDARIHYIYQENKGSPGARNTGIRNSRGDYLAFLDADDIYRSDKLGAQVNHLEQSPLIGLSYASRIEVDHLGNPYWLLSAPAKVALEDLILGFPFTINDLVVRRSWVERIGLFDESFRLHSEDPDFYLRLALEGCRFERTNHFVAYRRLHTGRVFKQIPDRIETMKRALETAFGDPRCPAEVSALRNQAYAKVYLTWACQEFIQEETSTGQEHLREAVRLDPKILTGRQNKLENFLVWFSIRDGGDHEEPLQRIFSQLPSEFGQIADKYPWAMARGYLIRGARETMWGRIEAGSYYLEKAAKSGAKFDESFILTFADQLVNYAVAYGPEKSRAALSALWQILSKLGYKKQLRRLSGSYSINQVFRDYHQGRYTEVPAGVLTAISYNPKYLANRGLIAVLFRSLIRALDPSHIRAPSNGDGF